MLRPSPAGVTYCALICLLCVATQTTAQSARPRSEGGGGSAGAIRGRLVQGEGGIALGGGAVTVRHANDRDTSFAGGAITRGDGLFHVDGLTPGRYSVRVRALGFTPIERRGIDVSATHPVIDLGDIALARTATRLEGQKVVAEQADIILAGDRNTYSTKNMSTASGGSSLDVLRNVPSVQVDGTNKLSLRGNENVVVQINGRSLTLHGEQLGNHLAQLPANSVSAVEVSTSPSAKNDPEGTAGIINLILNAQPSTPLSAAMTAASGTTGLVNLSGNAGRRVGLLILHLSGSFSRDSRKVMGGSSRTNLAVLPPFSDAATQGEYAPRTTSLTLRSEYRLSARNALFADGILTGSRYVRSTTSSYTDFDNTGTVIGRFDLVGSRVSRIHAEDYTIGFRHTGEATARTVASELRFTRGNYTDDAELLGSPYQGGLSPPSGVTSRNRDNTSAQYPTVSFQIDYTYPFGDLAKLESGLKSIARNTTSDFAPTLYDSSSGAFVTAAGANAFAYRERIHAAYAILSRQLTAVQMQAGLRIEQVTARLGVSDTSGIYEHRYASVFPSASITVSPTPTRQARLSYSRRINRPAPVQLSPVLYRESTRDVYHGNPFLQPEYADALEVTLQDTRGWGSIQVAPFLKRTAHAVRYIQTVDSSGVTLGTFANVASTAMTGADVNVTYHPGALTLLASGGVYRYVSNAANLAQDLSTHGTTWSARASVVWKFSPTVNGQLFTSYYAAVPTEGGSQGSVVTMNCALRRNLWGEKGSLTVRIADPFNMLVYGYRTAGDRVIESTERRYGTRGVFISISRSMGEQLKLRPRQQEPAPQMGPPGTP